MAESPHDEFRRGTSKSSRKLHEERQLKHLREEVEEVEKRYEGRGEAEVVVGAQLSQILQQWKADWHKKYNVYYDNGRAMGSMDWLKEMTGLNIRRLHGLLVGEYKVVSLSQADLVLTVIGKSDLITHGVIKVIPNPNWSFEHYCEYMQERGCW